MKAVLVIDMVEDFFADGPLKATRSELTERINTLTSRARNAGLPIIWVRQEFREDLSDAYLAMRKGNIKITIAGTPGAQLLSELEIAGGDYEVVKKRYSPFYGTELDQLLEDLNVTELLLAGVNTHACIRSTAVDAYQRDMEVTIPRDCVGSWDPEHHDVTLRYLGRYIARIGDLNSCA